MLSIITMMKIVYFLVKIVIAFMKNWLAAVAVVDRFLVDCAGLVPADTPAFVQPLAARSVAFVATIILLFAVIRKLSLLFISKKAAEDEIKRVHFAEGNKVRVYRLRKRERREKRECYREILEWVEFNRNESHQEQVCQEERRLRRETAGFFDGDDDEALLALLSFDSVDDDAVPVHSPVLRRSTRAKRVCYKGMC